MSPVVTARGALAALVQPRPGRAGYTLRLAAVCALITLVIEVYQLPSLATTVYVAFFVFRPDRSSTVVASIVITVFITFALLLSLGLTDAVLDHPFWRVCLMATFSFVVLFIGSASKLKPLAPILAMIVGYVLDLLGGLQAGEVAVRGLLYTWLVAAIPAGVCVAFALLASPAPRRVLEAGLSARLLCAARALRNDRGSLELKAFLQQGDEELKALLKSARREHALDNAADAGLTRAIDSTMIILSHTFMLVLEAADGAIKRNFACLAATLEKMAAIIRKGSYPIGIVPPHVETSGHGPAALALELLWKELAGFAEGPTSPPEAKAGAFMLPDAFTNPLHVHYALKTTGAAMACYLTFQLLDWPGIHTCLITCYVVSLGSAAETIEKLTLRICGCLIGAALGFATLIYIIPQIDGIAALAVVIALGTIPGAWIAASGPRVSYAGLQLAFAFYLTVLQKPTPAYDLSLGRDRIIGVIFGNLMIYLVFTRIWPVSICADIDPAFSRLLRSLADVARSGREAVRREAGALRNTAARLRQELRIARYEPISIRPTDRWLNVRELALDRIDDLQAPLLLVAAEADTERPATDTAQWLDVLARRVERGGQDGEVGAFDADQILRDRLSRLDTMLSNFAVSEPAHAKA